MQIKNNFLISQYLIMGAKPARLKYEEGKHKFAKNACYRDAGTKEYMTCYRQEAENFETEIWPRGKAPKPRMDQKTQTALCKQAVSSVGRWPRHRKKRRELEAKIIAWAKEQIPKVVEGKIIIKFDEETVSKKTMKDICGRYMNYLDLAEDSDRYGSSTGQWQNHGGKRKTRKHKKTRKPRRTRRHRRRRG